MKFLKTVMRPENSANALTQMCRNLKAKIPNIDTFVEVGSYMGESAVIFATEFSNAKIYCIDPWFGNFDSNDDTSSHNFIEVERQFDYRAEDFNNIVKIKKFSTEVEMDCDVIYIDGCHKYECVIQDIQHWKDKVKYAICGHDFCDEHVYKVHPHIAGVKKAVLELLGEPDERFEDGSWIKYLNKG